MTNTQHTPIRNGTIVRVSGAYARITERQSISPAHIVQNGCNCDGVHYLVQRSTDSHGYWYCPRDFETL